MQLIPEIEQGPASEHKPLVLCADDYGLSPGIDQGIVHLVQSGRLTGLGCLVQGARWPEAARRLTDTAMAGQADIGLHFNLTEPLAAAWHRPLPQLLRAAYLRQLPLGLIRDSLERQLDRFSAQLGRPPDYLDGHQHVHQLPGVRRVVAEVLERRMIRPWIRITEPVIATRGRDGFKARLIAALGGRVLRRTCLSRGWACNPAFGGVYDFSADASAYRQRLDHWLTHAPAGGLLMCHPATPALSLLAGDPIALARQAEYAVLAGLDWVDLLQRHRVRLIRGSVLYTGLA